jgi:hypothetical protein
MVIRWLRDQRGSVALGPTLRRDPWWLEILPTIALLGGFAIYATWAALQNAHYFAAPYLSPFYSPCLSETCAHVSLPLVGRWWTLSPAFLILWIPGGLRATCYYYRKAYYRAFFWAPPACAVPDRPKTYTGETRAPWLLQNLHRYFFWLSILVVAFLWWDALLAFRFPSGLGLGVGTLVLLANAALLSLFTFSCHSCRHICGGAVDVFSRSPRRQRLWHFVTRLNERHGAIGWASLVGVGLADLYVRLVSMGIIADLRIF